MPAGAVNRQGDVPALRPVYRARHRHRLTGEPLAVTSTGGASLRRAVQFCNKILLLLPDGLHLRAEGLDGLNDICIVREALHGLSEIFIRRVEIVDPDVSKLAGGAPDVLHGGLHLSLCIPDISYRRTYGEVIHILECCTEFGETLAELRLRLLLRRLDASGN